MRLKAAFTDSHLEISKHVYCVLFLLIMIPMIIGPITFFVLNSTETTCIEEWYPTDFPHLELSYCEHQIKPYSLGAWVYTSCVGWIPILNIIFGVIFSVKLNKILSKNDSDIDMKFYFKSLIVKICILTLTGSVSTITCYFLWGSFLLEIGAIFLYLDVLINVMVIGLMFKYNEKYYKKCCKCFIVLCLLNCDKSVDGAKEIEVFDYLDQSDQEEMDVVGMILKVSQSGTITESRTNTDSVKELKEDGANRSLKVMKSISELIHDVDENQHVVEVLPMVDDASNVTAGFN